MTSTTNRAVHNVTSEADWARAVEAAEKLGGLYGLVIVARALHVLAVVIWIGGIAMATTIALPAARHGDIGSDKFQAFQAIEHRFAWQARQLSWSGRPVST
jgi:putative copper export protein